MLYYNTSDETLVRKKIKHLQPLNYNRFYWWRRFTSKTKPLPNKSPFLDRIKNGDFEFSHYYWQWKLTELEINEAYKSYNGDCLKLLEQNQIDLSRRKKLMVDFEKDEKIKLESLKKGFLREFLMTKDDYYDELLNFDGTTEVMNSYCLKIFGLSHRRNDRRGRPPKNIQR